MVKMKKTHIYFYRCLKKNTYINFKQLFILKQIKFVYFEK